MRVYTTTNVDDLRTIGATFARLEATGYDGAFTFEAKHDPFIPLAVAAGSTERIALGTAVAIAFARNPMTLANVGYDLQVVSRGRFVLGLGSQIRPHIVNRYSAEWSQPAARMRELVSAVHAIWRAWETTSMSPASRRISSRWMASARARSWNMATSSGLLWVSIWAASMR